MATVGATSLSFLVLFAVADDADAVTRGTTVVGSRTSSETVADSATETAVDAAPNDSPTSLLCF